VESQLVAVKSVLTLILTLSTASLCFASLKDSADQLVQQAREECNSFENGMFEHAPQALISMDLSGDGVSEQIVDASQFSCSSSLTLWGGTGGTFLWIIDSAGVHEFLALDWTVSAVGNTPVLLLAVNPSRCGTVVQPCVQAVTFADGPVSVE